LATDNSLRRFTEVGQTHLRAITEASQLVLRELETG
jgi:hypothetical protein